MALFSVYDYDRKQFDYYQTPGNVTHQSLGSVKFSSFRTSRPTAGKKQFGNIAESVAFKLPNGAKKIGEGPEPRGVIASTLGENSIQMFGRDIPASKVAFGIAAIGIGFIMWRTFVPR